MAATGARAQKPVGSAAWISTEKENCLQLVNQELEEVEFPVQYEMEWLNEHMAEVFSSNQLDLADVFKTPGKLRGKTPRTIRKRDPSENRVPLSEIFSSVQKNRVDNKFSPSPAAHRSPAKAINAPTSAPTPPTKLKSNNATASQPKYPDLSQNLNSFSQYNTDSGYHGMPDDDDVILTQIAPDSQLSTQPLDIEPMSMEEEELPRQSVDRRTSDASFHSAREDVRNRVETVEPMNIDSPGPSIEEHPPQPQPAKDAEVNSNTDAAHKDATTPLQELESEPEIQDKPAEPVKLSSPAKPIPTQPPSPRQEQKETDKDDMVLDNLDDIGSPSDGSTPDRPPIRKSSLSFASLPAREPLTTKSLGGSRLSRTSHIDLVRPNNAGRPSYFGRQTGGQRTAPSEENSTQPEKMEIDDIKEANEDSDADTRASKLHNKSSTQRLHEKISMLGKLQPSRPTKSIPSVALSSAQVSYPELPPSKSDTKTEIPNPKPREAAVAMASEPVATNDDDWIRPLNSPYHPNIAKTQTADSKKKAPITASRPLDEPSPVNAPTKPNHEEIPRPHTRQGSETVRGKSSTPMFSSPRGYGHQKSASVNIDNKMTTTPISSPRQDGPLSASKSRLQSIVRSAKGLFTSSGGVSAAARMEASSPEEPRTRLERANTETAAQKQRPLSLFSPPRQEGRRTRSSTEKEEKRKQQELEERRREEEQAEKARHQEKARVMQQKTARERSHTESEARAPTNLPQSSSSPSRAPQIRPSSKENEPASEAAPRPATQSGIPQQQASRQTERRPTKPTRELQQKSKPQPVSIRVNSAISRQMPLASSVASSAQETSAPAPVPPPSASKPPTLKKKASNSSLHTASSNSSFKSSVSSQTQRKAQLASERKREQEEREARRKEEQRRDLERKRQQEEARRQNMRSRAEAEHRERPVDDPKKATHMQAIEKRRLENARRLERQGSQQPPDMGSNPHPEKTAPSSSLPQRGDMGTARPPSRIGSVQPYGRAINQPQPNPAKPPKRGPDEEASHRHATAKPGAMQPSGETKRRRTDDEQNRAAMRPTMGPPIRQSNIRKEPGKSSIYGHGQHSAAAAPGSSIFKPAQSQRPAHPMDMSKYASGKIPFAESSNAAQAPPHKTPGASSSKKAAAKPSPNYPNSDNIPLPEIQTDSEDEDSDAEMMPVPSWAQPNALNAVLRDQNAEDAENIFGPVAPFSLEEAFKSDKRLKKFRERTSSANWSGPDGLTQEEIRRDIAGRQRLQLNGGWTFGQ